MVEALVGRYWCYMCSQMVSPVMEVEIKCPFCESGFVEEMGSNNRRGGEEDEIEVGSDRALSLWAQILLGMMDSSPIRRRRRLRRFEMGGEDEDDETQEAEDTDETEEEGRSIRDLEREARSIGDLEREARSIGDLERDLESIIRRRRRRRRSSAAILQLLQGLQTGTSSDTENSERERERERERVIMIDPFNQTIILQGTVGGSNRTQFHNQSNVHIPGSLGDYLVGPNLELLLQHLAENDPNRYGTPPAHKDSVEAMPTVKVHESLQCSVCLEDFEIGGEAKEMPCNHKFHNVCILSWLDLHSSCPVCRFQMPVEDESSSGNRE
ncbi:hypothetical protein GIB67_037729 [Kingdonia uniflora]|uniref:RING-type E3 ubiquitin transferase n=1 Tax=Kingdonia uniflora TaxID=39325 RepID=A0A7J7LV24_9MAGN|nr:hypothetical protein GIB67_037729 [Kingdonia uniflora]